MTQRSASSKDRQELPPAMLEEWLEWVQRFGPAPRVHETTALRLALVGTLRDMLENQAREGPDRQPELEAYIETRGELEVGRELVNALRRKHGLPPVIE